MRLPMYGPPEERHAGPCQEQPEYAYARRVAFERTSETGDRLGRKGEAPLTDPVAMCCRDRGFNQGEKEG
jgi:hypothetical protein